ncbi:hypothetical protein IFM89_023942 [Coptis chinensis]|uniref:PDZ domain-containing protein n=1 Tax=Coptis chinensis TaxID=261450 RepID=A0A835I4W6_9MAGN|nr:hypothetical protein IFM89_023942 [Coptis chinensis]
MRSMDRVVSIIVSSTVNYTSPTRTRVTPPHQWHSLKRISFSWEAWKTIDRAYVDKSFNGQSWFHTAIRKMLATLDDPFTHFLEPEKFKSLRVHFLFLSFQYSARQSGTQGALTGVGLSIGYSTVIDESSTGLVVISSTPGAPASRAGIVSGDIILAIDGINTGTMGIYDAAERLQGPDGSLVELTIQSGPDVKLMSLNLDYLEVAAGGKGTSRIGYIKLTTFNQNASNAVKDAIETLRRNNVNAFVLDLRDNSGGFFQKELRSRRSDGSDAIATSEPLAVLVNKGTASASEILAGALKDNKRAVVFGEPTFGKGKIQSVFELSDGSGLAVTVARYETPAHTDIDKVEVIPDHPLPASFPRDADGFCRCLKDPASACQLNNVALFAR